MKRIFFLIITMEMSISVFAQAPQKMSYQAVIRDASYALVTNHSVGMRISILEGSTNGTVVYTETQTTTTNANGLVSIEIGGGTDFDAINWGSGSYFIKTETDPTGGTNYTIIGINQILSVPYALYAKTSETSLNVATKADLDALLNRIEILEGKKVVDIDGNVYGAVTIGAQTWMAENLKTTKYNDNTPIPLVEEATEWSNLTSPGYCYRINNPEISYGAYYNWYAVNTGKICPTGWHVPSDAEWTILDTYLGGVSVAGPKLMETGTFHWPSPNTVATNESGFTALPAGYRNGSEGNFYGFGTTTTWFTSSAYNSSTAYIRSIYDSGGYVRGTYSMNTGYSIRCIKD